MSNNEMKRTLQIAQKLAGRFPEGMDKKLKHLLQRAKVENNPSIEMEIDDLLITNENIRLWMREQDQLYGEQRGTRLEYLPGSHGPVSARWKWTCPTAGCVESWPVIQEGEDPPICDVHRCRMVRGD